MTKLLMNAIVLDEDDNDVEMVDACDYNVEMSGTHVKTIDTKVSQDDEKWPSALDEDDNLEHNADDYLQPETPPIIGCEVGEKGKQRAVAKYGEGQASSDSQEIERLKGIAQERAGRLKTQAQQIEAQEKKSEGLKEAMTSHAKSLEQAEQQLAEERQHAKRLREQLLRGPRSRQNAIRSNVRTERGLGRPARPDRKHVRELEKQAQRFRNSQAENDAEIAEAAAKALEEDRRSQEAIARLKKDLEASQDREKDLEEDEKGLSSILKVLEAFLDTRDEDCRVLSMQMTKLTRAKEAAEAHAEALRLANRSPQDEKKNSEADLDERLEAWKNWEKNARKGADGERETDDLLGVPETVNEGLLGPVFPGWKSWVVSMSVGFVLGLLVVSSVASGAS